MSSVLWRLHRHSEVHADRVLIVSATNTPSHIQKSALVQETYCPICLVAVHFSILADLIVVVLLREICQFYLLEQEHGISEHI